MNGDYHSPQGYVNPVPEPGESRPKLSRKRARALATTPIPWTSSVSAAMFVRLLGAVIAAVLVLAGPIRHEISDRFGVGDGSIAADGTVSLGGGEVTARFSPSGDERVTEEDRNGGEFSGQDWILQQGNEMVSVRSYRFSNSPVKSRAVREGYYAAAGRALVMDAGHDVKPRPITRDGRDGRVWSTRGDTGVWLVLAEFPGNPVTARIRCRASSRESVVAGQCKEVLDSLQFSD